jgi:hypothetical protein
MKKGTVKTKKKLAKVIKDAYILNVKLPRALGKKLKVAAFSAGLTIREFVGQVFKEKLL